jgi:Lecithin retinol acyltransferase
LFQQAEPGHDAARHQGYALVLMTTSPNAAPAEPIAAAVAFRPGDHLRVRRHWKGFPYMHHGVFVGGAPEYEIVQFGGGDRRKPEGIGYTSLDGFQRGAQAELVPHGRYEGIHWLPKADAPETIVLRARWLAEHSSELSPQAYNLVGHNCEHIANWCVCGYTESHQYKRALLAATVVKAGLYFYVSWRVGRGTASPRLWAALLPNVLSTWTIHVYNREIKHFWERVGAGP